MIELIVWMREGRTAGSRKQDEEIEAEADRVRQEKEVEAKSRQFIANLRS
jgi:hypothetical protein